MVGEIEQVISCFRFPDFLSISVVLDFYCLRLY